AGKVFGEVVVVDQLAAEVFTELEGVIAMGPGEVVNGFVLGDVAALREAGRTHAGEGESDRTQPADGGMLGGRSVEVEDGAVPEEAGPGVVGQRGGEDVGP